MGLEKCECGHNAIKCHKIDRHFYMLPDGRQVYSDYCQEPDCRCERAKIIERRPQLDIHKEKARWAKIAAEVLG